MNEPKTDWDHIDPKDPKGYYAYFGVTPSAEPSQITEAYIKVIRECAGNQFVLSEATKAYAALSNEHKRREYDTQYGATRAQSKPPHPNTTDTSRDSSYLNLPPTRMSGMPAEMPERPVGKRNQPHQGGNSDGCTGCIIIFVILLIISGVINLFKSIG